MLLWRFKAEKPLTIIRMRFGDNEYNKLIESNPDCLVLQNPDLNLFDKEMAKFIWNLIKASEKIKIIYVTSKDEALWWVRLFIAKQKIDKEKIQFFVPLIYEYNNEDYDEVQLSKYGGYEYNSFENDFDDMISKMANEILKTQLYTMWE